MYLHSTNTFAIVNYEVFKNHISLSVLSTNLTINPNIWESGAIIEGKKKEMTIYKYYIQANYNLESKQY